MTSRDFVAVSHDVRDVVKRRQIRQRIAATRDEVGPSARRHRADVIDLT